jgi:hypothetical protein
MGYLGAFVSGVFFTMIVIDVARRDFKSMWANVGLLVVAAGSAALLVLL